MTIHIRLWSGSKTARITDMTNAGKRGKVCQVLRFSGAPWDAYSTRCDDVQRKASHHTVQIAWCVENELKPDTTFAEAKAKLAVLVEAARADGVPETYVAVYDETIKGIDAPREKLRAGVDGLWNAGADESGIGIYAENDVNEWAEITHGQTGPKAYDIARKVWPLVKQAKTLHEARDILSQAGARLHGYCRLD